LTDDKFAKEELGLDANVCQTHATAIAANNGSHKKYFDYDCFYGFFMRLQRYSIAAVGRQVSCVSFTSIGPINVHHVRVPNDLQGVLNMNGRQYFSPTGYGQHEDRDEVAASLPCRTTRDAYIIGQRPWLACGIIVN
jgi:hypothetical protein